MLGDAATLAALPCSRMTWTARTASADHCMKRAVARDCMPPPAIACKVGPDNDNDDWQRTSRKDYVIAQLTVHMGLFHSIPKSLPACWQDIALVISVWVQRYP